MFVYGLADDEPNQTNQPNQSTEPINRATVVESKQANK